MHSFTQTYACEMFCFPKNINMQIQFVIIFFSAAVPDKKEEFEIENLDFETIPAHLEKSCIIDRSEPGVLCHQSADVESTVRDMVSVAVRIKLDSTPLSDLTRDEKIKVSYQEHYQLHTCFAGNGTGLKGSKNLTVIHFKHDSSRSTG